jgi:hypothetical protein
MPPKTRTPPKRGHAGVRATNSSSDSSSSTSEPDSTDEEFLPNIVRSHGGAITESESERSEDDQVDVAAPASATKRKAAPLIDQWTLPTRDNGPKTPKIDVTPEQAEPKAKGAASSETPWRPWAVFSLYWSFELLNKICDATNSRETSMKQALTPILLLKFLAISVCMGYNKQPRIRDYWTGTLPGKPNLACFSTTPQECGRAGLGVPIFREIMDRETFEAIKGNISFAVRGVKGDHPKVPKSSGLYPRLWKVWLLLDRLLNWGRGLFIPGLYIVIDEAMVFCRGVCTFVVLCASVSTAQ